MILPACFPLSLSLFLSLPDSRYLEQVYLATLSALKNYGLSNYEPTAR